MPTTYRIRARVRALPSAPLTVLFWRKGELPLPAAESRRVREHLGRVGARGETQEITVVPLPKGTATRTLVAVGCGEKLTLDTFRRGVASGVQQARQLAVREMAVLVPKEMADGRAIGAAIVEGVALGGYTFTRYQADRAKQERARAVRSVEIVVEPRTHAAVQEGIRAGKILVAATVLARDLVNEPASKVTPQALANEARRIASSSRGHVTVEVLDRAACEKRGMGAFLAVAQGSTHAPFFVHLTYTPRGSVVSSPARKGVGERGEKKLPIVALIGKGITFDSGGLSLKSAASMETMKVDMAGAAAVFGVFSALPALKLPVIVHGFVAACENMPSGSSTRPGDIVRSASGKTIEIRNTDAEGRLTLADALTEARNVKPDAMVDLATLTGACVVALGEEVAGIFASDATLARRIIAAAHHAGESLWELPLVPTYRDQLKSTVADLKNISGKRWADAILGALFLQEFVGGTPWAHLDIAGPAYAEQQTNPVVPVGASGFGVRTLINFLQRFTEQQS